MAVRTEVDLDMSQTKHSWDDWDEDDIELELAPFPVPVAETRHPTPEDAAIGSVDSARRLRQLFDRTLASLTEAERAVLVQRLKKGP